MWNFKKLSDLMSSKNRIPLKKNSENDLLRLQARDVDITFVKNFLSQPFVNANTMITHSHSMKTTTLLWAAVYNQDEELIDYLVAEGADVNLKSVTEGTPLEVALLLRNLTIFRKLHQLGADINIPLGKPNSSLLLTALKFSRSEIAEYLIRNGADVNVVNFDGFYTCALHYAAKSFSKKIVKLLLDQKADINVQARNGETALTIAVRLNKIDVIKLLIDRGANISYRRSNNATILHDLIDRMADKYKCDEEELWLEVSENLLSADEFTAVVMNDGKSLLHYCLIRGIVGLIKPLLDAGVDVNAVSYGYSLAIEMVKNEKEYFFHNLAIKEHIVKLISAGFDVCERNKRTVKRGFENFKIKCLIEVEKMKITQVGESNISFFDVLSKNVHYLLIRIRFASLGEVLNKEKLRREYPLYGGMLFYNLSKVYRRIKYLEKLEETIEEMLCCSLALPYDFVRNLWFYFSNIELKKFCNMDVIIFQKAIL